MSDLVTGIRAGLGIGSKIELIGIIYIAYKIENGLIYFR